MELQDILIALADFNGQFPYQAVRAARVNRTALIPRLLDNLNYIIENYQTLPRHYIGHIFSVFLLAEFRERSAFTTLIQAFSLPDHWPQLLFGDTLLSYDAANILASTYDGNIEFITSMIENENLHDYVRCVGVETLLALLATGQITRDFLIEYFRELLSGRLAHHNNLVWSDVIASCVELRAHDLLPLIEKAYADNTLSGRDFNFQMIQKIFADSVREESPTATPTPYHLIEDVILDMAWWTCFKYPHGIAENDEKFEFDEYYPRDIPHQWPHPRMSAASLIMTEEVCHE
jgi:hypothetical protein